MNIPWRHPSAVKVVPLLCLLALWLFQILPVHAQATSWPTDWSCEPLQDTSGEWWESLRINTVPGVLYHLQESESLTAGSWATLETSYGTGTEWICQLFPGKAPAVAPPLDLSTPSVIPAAGPRCRNAFLTIENTTTGGVLISWNSLDDATPKRMVLPSVTLDPVWYEFDSSYMLAHGAYYFSLSPRLGTPLDFSEPAPPLGPQDSEMVAAFMTALPDITANITNSVASAASSFGQRPEVNGNRKFFRVAADWGLDSDGDGRLDWQEIIFDGNNPFAADSDGDGILDVAQDNSGPAPTLDGGPSSAAETGPVMAALSSPPRATIERYLITANKLATYRPNWPGWAPEIWLSAPELPPEQMETLRDKATYEEFLAGMADLPFNESKWASWVFPYRSIRLKSEPSEGNSDPRLDGEYTDSFYVTRCAFRLRLDAPAPAGGYRIPLRVMSYVIRNVATLAYRDGPFSGIGYEDLMLEVDEGETIGKPAMASNPVIQANQQINTTPLIISLRHYNSAGRADFVSRSFQDGACILLGDGISASISPYYSDTNRITIGWQMRQLSGDGQLWSWSDVTQYYGICPPFPGIYQIQALFKFPDGTKIPVPYLRMADAKAIINGNNEKNALLKAGQPDYIGVCRNELSLKLRDEAIRWLGRTDYAWEAKVSVKPGSLFNPSTWKKNKCNIFLTHLANRMGAETPYFYRKSKKHWYANIVSLIPSAPLARDDWHLDPELNIDLDLPGWLYSGENSTPSPGMSAASYGKPPNSGHCGILDYDGSWISAGQYNINKSIHLSDQSQHYKPTHFRRR